MSGDHDPGSVSVYDPGGSSPIRTITDGITRPTALVFDGSGNLYVLNFGGGSSVSVYAAGGSDPIRTITDGIVGSEGLGGGGALAVDGSGNFYVANEATFSGPGSVTVYSPGGTSPKLTVTQGIQNPIAVAIDP